jgi:LemA protein
MRNLGLTINFKEMKNLLYLCSKLSKDKINNVMSVLLITLSIIKVVLLGLWVIITYNRFVAKSNRVKQTESSIFVMLKQRNDMIPNLVAAVQNYTGHENATLTKIAELRSLYQQAGTQHEQMELGTELSAKLADIKVAVESYPELKADKQFVRLEQAIEEMEYQLQAARRTFNAAAVDFNNYVLMFPSNLIASAKNYRPLELITVPESEMANVNVKSLFKRDELQYQPVTAGTLLRTEAGGAESTENHRFPHALLWRRTALFCRFGSGAGISLFRRRCFLFIHIKSRSFIL